MRLALREAERAPEHGDVPMGAVIVLDGEVIAAAGNERELRKSPVAHAEMLAIEEAAARMSSWRLLNTVLYVTMEPCPMCAGAIVQARIPRLVYGAPDEKAGAAGTSSTSARTTRLNHCLEITSGVLADESWRCCASSSRRDAEPPCSASAPTSDPSRSRRSSRALQRAAGARATSSSPASPPTPARR